MKKLLLLLFVGISQSTFAQHPCIPPAVTITGTNWKCKGVKDTLTVSGPIGTTYLWNNGSTNTIYYTGPIDADSTLYVIATNAGCTDTTYFSIVLRLPISYVPRFTIICACSPITLEASKTGTPPYTFSWSPGGETTDTITVAPCDTTTYTVTETYGSGCRATQVTTVSVESCAGVNTITTSTNYNIYPNPSSTEFTLDLPRKALLNVCDITGRILFSEMENAGTVNFGRELNPGIYFLFIDGKTGGKIVKL